MAAGPYYFAFVDSTETTFGGEHVRNDLSVFSFKLTHGEGAFAQLDVEVANPGIGLLAPGRKYWLWFSVDRDGDYVTEMSTESEPSERGVEPLFFGRLLGYPADVQGETVTLTFVARPADYAVQQAIVAETKKVAPYWDSIWFDPKDASKPDLVLESRPEMWHIDRVTHEVSTSNIITGEDGTLLFGEADTFYDGLRVTVNQTPVRRVELTAAVAWEQIGINQSGLDFAPIIGKASRAAGAALGANGNTIGSYTGPGLQEDWPKAGQSFGGGWMVTGGELDTANRYNSRTYFDNWPTPGRMARRGGSLRQSPAAEPAPIPSADFDPAGALAAFEQSQSYFLAGTWGPLVVGYNSPYQNWVNDVWGGPGHPAVQTGSGPVDPLASGARSLKTKVWVPRWDCTFSLNIGYDVKRSMKESVAIVLEADMQAILTDPGDEEVIQLSMESGELVSLIDLVESSESGPVLTMPIRDVRARTYFASARGTQSIEYLICVARAHLLARSRAIAVTFTTDFNTAVDAGLSCRKQAYLEDYRLPGGNATGKIVNYALSGDGDSGVFGAEITMACAVGRGNSVTGDPGEPCYVEEGYVETGYQRYDGELIVPIPGEVYYGSIEGETPNDDGVDFRTMEAKDMVISCTLANGWREQEVPLEIGAGAGDPSGVFEKLNEAITTITLELQPLNVGPFQTDWAITTSMLMVPKMIDLEAA
jgi:hypothetical protein